MKFFQNAAKSFAKEAKASVKRDMKRNASAKIRDNFATEFTFTNGVFLTTFRQNGNVVEGNTRDTIDTGALKDSISVEWSGDTLKITSDSPYYAYVMYGYVTTKGRIVPPRIQELTTLR